MTEGCSLLIYLQRWIKFPMWMTITGILLLVSFIGRVNRSTQHDRFTEKKPLTYWKTLTNLFYLKLNRVHLTMTNEQESSSQTWVIGDGYGVNPIQLSSHNFVYFGIIIEFVFFIQFWCVSCWEYLVICQLISTLDATLCDKFKSSPFKTETFEHQLWRLSDHW